MGNKARFDGMKAFFAGVGEGDTAGVWEKKPEPVKKAAASKKPAAGAKPDTLKDAIGC